MARIAESELPEGTSEQMQNNLHRVLAGNRATAEAFYDLAWDLHKTTRLPLRLRELAILRTAAKLGSDFEWSHHFKVAPGIGISTEEARAVRDNRLGLFSEEERCLLHLVDAVDDRTVDDALWARARGFLDEGQLLDLVMVASFYGCASRMTVALDVKVDPGFTGLADS